MDNEYYTTGEKEFLLKIAYKTLEKFLLSGERFEPQTINKKLWEKKGVFITLSLNNRLHGCMGNLESAEALILSIRNNTILASNDPRFEQFKLDDLNRIIIEIAILSELKKVAVEDIKYGDGILIKRGADSATYLPSVWTSLGNKDDFLASLFDKARLSINYCNNQETDFWVYNTISFKSNMI